MKNRPRAPALTAGTQTDEHDPIHQFTARPEPTSRLLDPGAPGQAVIVAMMKRRPAA